MIQLTQCAISLHLCIVILSIKLLGLASKRLEQLFELDYIVSRREMALILCKLESSQDVQGVITSWCLHPTEGRSGVEIAELDTLYIIMVLPQIGWEPHAWPDQVSLEYPQSNIKALHTWVDHVAIDGVCRNLIFLKDIIMWNTRRKDTVSSPCLCCSRSYQFYFRAGIAGMLLRWDKLVKVVPNLVIAPGKH